MAALTSPPTIWVSSTGASGAAGTQAAPVRTIQEAIDRAQPGTTIQVMAGVYTENLKINRVSGTADAPITIVSADGVGAAEIRPAVETRDTIEIEGVNYVTVDGFKIVGPVSDALQAIQIHVKTTATSWVPPTYITIQNNIIVAGEGDGIKGSKAEYLFLLNNTITKTTGDESGIDFVGVNHSVIANNTISSEQYIGIMIKGGSQDILIQGNRVDGTGTSGVEIGGYTNLSNYWPGFLGTYAYEAKDVRFIGNTVVNTGSTALRLIGAQNVEVSGNTIQTDSRYMVTVDDSAVYHEAWLSSDISFSNNNFGREAWLTNRSAGTGIDTVNESTATTPPPVVESPPPVVESPPPVVVNEITGTSSANTLKGTGGADSIDGLGGNDTLYGYDGDDELLGDSGNDTLYGGNGSDWLDGGIGADSLKGEDGDDYLFGGEGDDRLDGAAGNNTLDGGNGADKLYAGTGNDLLIGGQGNDLLEAGAGNDTLSGDGGGDKLYGRTGDDILLGGDGDDLLDGGADKDVIDGGAGADTLLGRDGNDVLSGGAGIDKLTGGGGADQFVFERDGGRDTITDFSTGGGDTIGIVGMGADDFSDIHLRSDGSGGTIVSVDVDGVATDIAVVSNVAPTALMPDDFFF